MLDPQSQHSCRSDMAVVNHARTSPSQSSSKRFPNFAEKETRHVWYAKSILMAILLSVAVALGMAAYTITSRDESDDFEQQFEAYAFHLSETLTSRMNEILSSVSVLSAGITMYAMEQNNEEPSWPFVTVPHWPARTASALDSPLQLLSLLPLVSGDDRAAWEEYSIQHNQEWTDQPISPFISKVDDNLQPVHDDAAAAYFPIWQTIGDDAFSHQVNFNALHFPFLEVAIEAVIETNQTVLSPVLESSMFVHSQDIHSVMVMPVWNDVAPHHEENASSSLVAVLTAFVPWKETLDNMLKDGVHGIHIILKDGCNDEDAHSYRLDGPNATYLGPSDLHDPIYDPYEVIVDVGSTAMANIHQYCSLTFHIFPSHEFQTAFETHQPILYMSAVVLMVLLASFAFLVYDRFLQQRQDKVIIEAEKSNALVDSLFPATFKERILSHSSETVDHTNPSSAIMTPRTASITPRRSIDTVGELSWDRIEFPDLESDDDSCLLDDVTDVQEEGGRSRYDPSAADHDSTEFFHDSEPIADSFPEATVMFADIVGFTSWSAKRDPSEVFKLLETLYNAFDIVANRRQVFKVETIGDCYVAVAGLPYPRDDHAIVMCRFARECMERMKEVVHRLEPTLGPETLNLFMRFGLHSGEVTAGVLRGEKSRFQLFGDTVNTAARMETTAISNRIHLSQDTVNYLILADKGHWVVAREETILVKGKGRMQTYWLETMKSRRNSIIEPIFQRPTLDKKSQRKLLAMHESIGSISIGCPVEVLSDADLTKEPTTAEDCSFCWGP